LDNFLLQKNLLLMQFLALLHDSRQVLALRRLARTSLRHRERVEEGVSRLAHMLQFTGNASKTGRRWRRRGQSTDGGLSDVLTKQLWKGERWAGRWRGNQSMH
jgi:hypothetical protein